MKISLKELSERVEKAKKFLEQCRVCPRECKTNRLKGEIGRCGVGEDMLVSSYGPHHGEESPLSGWNGSGTIFFAGCNLECVFCQNYDISQLRHGSPALPKDVAKMMIALQDMGCHNINLVTPSHIIPQILSALKIAKEQGLTLPIVYNSGGYDSVPLLKLLDGIIDIYMPDFKYSDADIARRFSHIEDYPQIAKEAIKEMHRQVGDLIIDSQGIAKKGLLIRHLVLPDNLQGSEEIMRFLSHEISKDTYINIMAQYRPCWQAFKEQSLSRSPTWQEMKEVYALAKREGLWRFDK